MATTPATETGADIQALAEHASQRSPKEAATYLAAVLDADVASALARLNPMVAQQILAAFPETKRAAVLAAAPEDIRAQWAVNRDFADGTIGRLMDPPVGVFKPDWTVAQTVEALRTLTKRAFITYGYVENASGKLVGVLVMRELLLARPDQTLAEIMLRDPFALRPEMTLTEAMKAVLNKHFPVYPVCDQAGHLIGLVRGQNLFEAQAIEISAQAGSMVGVEKEERLSTPFKRSLFMRHPWLQVNLVTVFIAAAVVGMFEGILDRVVILAIFLPVLAGQSGNTGCQALAVMLRGMTLGEWRPGTEKKLLIKEGMLGLANGALVGFTAGLGMLIFATIKGRPDAIVLGGIVFTAMVISCVISGISGVITPLVLKKLGADPATASSIFLTTITDVISNASFLGLATLLLGSSSS